jgi:hypothetical protein
VQEANRFYETVKSSQTHADSGMHSPRRFALAGKLDEYGDIRSRPNRDSHARSISTEPRDAHQTLSPGAEGEGGVFARDTAAIASHDFETDMFQWPFIDGTWSAGFDAGLDGLWHHSGLFDANPAMR